MNPYIYLLIALAFATTLGYLAGKEKNKAIGKMIGAAAEKVLAPEDTEYINIGGVLGHNFTYKLNAPFTEAKGTFTLLPRHSVLYIPLSLLISRHDRFYLHLFTEGEGHIIAEKYYPKMRVDIAGVEKLKRDTATSGEKRFIILYDNPRLEKNLRTLLENIEGTEHLLHFCCYRGNSNFFIHVIPKAATLEPLLDGIYRQLPEMMENRRKS
jgi:hypothetical protein